MMFPKVALFVSLLPSMFVQGLRMQRSTRAGQGQDWGSCDSEEYGKSGKWVDSKTEWGFVWDDQQCGVLPEFSSKTFCQEKLQCQNMLFVGDSTISEFYFALYETMDKEATGIPFLNVRHERFDGKGIHPSSDKLAEGYSEKEYATDCGKPQYEGEPNQRRICQQHCDNEVHMTLIRHDHLNDKRRNFAVAGGRFMCAWKQELADHPWVVMHTGTHVNDDKETLYNEDNLWEKRADDLFGYLKQEHPHNIIWRTASTGLTKEQMTPNMLSGAAPCPDPDFIRKKPLEVHEVGSDFKGSWQQFTKVNKVYTTKLHEHLPGSLVLDIEPLMSMRGDCRADPIHFNWHKPGAGVHMWSRMLQSFMKPLVQ